MALFEFFCKTCGKKFEEILSSSDQKVTPPCPICQDHRQVEKLISRFAVGGRGDLRESTFHGCHEYTGGPDHDHQGHSHGHDHDHNHDSGDST